MNRKIFCIGFNKSGTTTLHHIFKDQLGLDSIHKGRWTYWSAFVHHPRIESHDAFTDGESPLVNRLIRQYPDALYILNSRPLKSWLISRHKAAVRTKTSMQWLLSDFLGLKFLSRLISKYHLKIDDRMMLQWVQIRNSYHKYVMQLFEKDDRLFVMNIEDELDYDRLRAFLNCEERITSEWVNKDGSASGGGSTPNRILELIEQEVNPKDSTSIVESFLERKNLESFADNYTFFLGESYLLRSSLADKVMKKLPFIKPLFQAVFLFAVRNRGGSKNFISKTMWDSLIALTRSKLDLSYYMSVYYHV